MSGRLQGEARAEAFLALSGVSKRYGGVSALDQVDFAAKRHSIHAVLGENGAGKSTLMKVLSGVAKPDQGNLRLDGQGVTIATPRDAQRLGIATIFQELSLMPDLSVADNICITEASGRWGFFNPKKQLRRAEALLAEIECEDINPKAKVETLPLSRRQMVEIAKALGRDPRVLILDEATSALTAADVERVFTLLNRLRDRGLTILYISHRMHEIETLADTCTVFRNGRSIETFRQGSKTPDEIVRLMIGRSINQVFPEKPTREARPEPLLEVRGLSWEDQLTDVDLTVGAGEIVGLGGLEGQGQQQLVLALFGVLRSVSGEVRLDGRRISLSGPAAAKAPDVGIAMIPEDRKTEGLLLPMSVRDNLSLASIGRMSRWGLVDGAQESDLVDRMVEKLQIKVSSLAAPVSTLSGGNQQKVVIGKWLSVAPRCLLLMDPTRGIDVGTKQELYRLLRELAAQGTAILFYSTDVDELIGLCDRVGILYGGRIVRELEGPDVTEHNIIATALNWAQGADGDQPTAAA
ncbi:MAG: sugar ABC transporter ATP-binding protein [Kiloniellales bacterium]